MKYPQFVSKHAVNAVSDWLESRLEQLGVDPPVVYSRLLISLLHTPLQLHASELAELADKKAQYATRSRQRRSSDPQLQLAGRNNNAAGAAAVAPRSRSQSLKRVEAIESLAVAVNTAELHLEQIESLVDELCVRLRAIESQSNSYEEDDNPFEHAMVNHDASATGAASSSMVVAVQPQPESARCYFKAFPALDKSLNNKVQVMPRWGGRQQETNNNDNHVANNNTWPAGRSSSESSSSISGPQSSGGGNEPTTGPTANATESTATKRTRSRRNRGGRGRTNAAAATCGEGTWDTNFSGAWEMGFDMIREFVLLQESRGGARCKDTKEAIIPQEEINRQKDKPSPTSMHGLRARYEVSDAEYALEREQMYQSPVLVYMHGSDFEQATTDGSDLFADEDFESMVSPSSRRLYEREASPQDHSCGAVANDEEARFESKFNNTMADLWDDAKTQQQPQHQEQQSAAPSLISFWSYYNSHRYEASISPNNPHELGASDFYETSVNTAQAMQYETMHTQGGYERTLRGNQVADCGSYIEASGQYNVSDLSFNCI